MGLEKGSQDQGKKQTELSGHEGATLTPTVTLTPTLTLTLTLKAVKSPQSPDPNPAKSKEDTKP